MARDSLAPKTECTQISTSERKCSTGNPQSTKSQGKDKKHSDPGKSAYSCLTIRQKQFVKNITNKDSTTFGNATRSYLSAHPVVTTGTAAVEGHRCLKNPKIQTAIEQEFAAQGLDCEVSARTLAGIVRGEYRAESITYDGKDKVITRTVSSPKPADIIKANDLYFKVTGIKDAAKAAVDIAKDRELMRLIERNRKEGYLPQAGGGGD